MEYLDSVVRSANANITYNRETIYTFTDLLTNETNHPMASLPNTFTNMRMDLDDHEVINKLVLSIVDNFQYYGQKFTLNQWRHISEIVMRVCGSSKEEKLAKLKFSFLVIVSSHPGDTVYKYLSEIDACTVKTFEGTLADNVMNYLNCSEVRQALEQSTCPHFDSNYPIPPNILIAHGVTKLLGWVCLWDTIVISSDLMNTNNEPYREMALANIIAHVCQHGIIRRSLNNFNVHSPEEFGDAEAEGMFEDLVWGGMPLWHQPRSIEEANSIATQYFQGLAETGTLPQKHRDNREFFTAVIGWDKAQDIVGGVHCRHIIYFR